MRSRTDSVASDRRTAGARTGRTTVPNSAATVLEHSGPCRARCSQCGWRPWRREIAAHYKQCSWDFALHLRSEGSLETAMDKIVNSPDRHEVLARWLFQMFLTVYSHEAQLSKLGQLGTARGPDRRSEQGPCNTPASHSATLDLQRTSPPKRLFGFSPRLLERLPVFASTSTRQAASEATRPPAKVRNPEVRLSPYNPSQSAAHLGRPEEPPCNSSVMLSKPIHSRSLQPFGLSMLQAWVTSFWSPCHSACVVISRPRASHPPRPFSDNPASSHRV